MKFVRSMIELKVNAKSVEEVNFVSMVDGKVNAKSVEEVKFVSMIELKVNAKSVEEVKFVNMEDKEVNANNVFQNWVQRGNLTKLAILNRFQIKNQRILKRFPILNLYQHPKTLIKRSRKRL